MSEPHHYDIEACFNCGYPLDGLSVICHHCHNNPKNDNEIMWWVAYVILSGGRFATLEELESIGDYE